MQTLYEYIKNESFVLNKTMRQVAEEMNISHATLYHLQHRAPSRITYHKIAKYFNKDVRELINLPITHNQEKN